MSIITQYQTNFIQNLNTVDCKRMTLKEQVENRNFDIITCSESTKNLSSLRQTLPKLPRLGQKKDHPYPKNTINYEYNIVFNKPNQGQKSLSQ